MNATTPNQPDPITTKTHAQMNTPTKQDLLNHYATREPKKFLQLDGFLNMHNDHVIKGDENGDGVCRSEVHELMEGSDCRALIPEKTSPTEAARLLRKIADLVDPAGAPPEPLIRKWDIEVQIITDTHLFMRAKSEQVADDILNIKITVVDKSCTEDRYMFIGDRFYKDTTKKKALNFRVANKDYVEQFSPNEIIAEIVADVFRTPLEAVWVREYIPAEAESEHSEEVPF